MAERSVSTDAETTRSERAALFSFGRPASLRGALIALLAVALLPAGGLAIGKAINTVREARALRDAALIAQFETFVDDERALFAFARNLLLYARDDVADAVGDAQSCNVMMERLARAEPRFHAAHFTSVDGYIRCGSGAFDEPIYVGDGAGFESGAMSPESSARVIFGRSSRMPVLVIAEPVFDEDGVHLGALTISISIGLMDALTKVGDDDAAARIALIPLDGVTSGPVAQDWGGQAWLPAEPWPRRGGAGPQIWEAENAGGDAFVYVMGEVRDGGLVALAGWPADRLSSVLGAETALSLALPVFTWLFASLIIYFAIKQMVIRNLDRLAGLTERIRAGDLGARAGFADDSPLEFVRLGHDFDAMAEGIEERDSKLRRAVNEQKLLLREVYHRVKNNLQLIVSLINLQVRDASEGEESRLLRQTQDRVQSLALVHQSLYQIGNLSEARLDTVLEQIVDALLSVRDASPDARAKIGLDLDPTPLDADRAVPSALLATEALLNAFKHTRFGQSEARIDIMLRSRVDGGFMLEIVNDVPSGAPENAATPSSKKLGARLMQGFARQLRANLSQTTQKGRFKTVVVAPAPTPASASVE